MKEPLPAMMAFSAQIPTRRNRHIVIVTIPALSCTLTMTAVKPRPDGIGHFMWNHARWRSRRYEYANR